MMTKTFMSREGIEEVQMFWMSHHSGENQETKVFLGLKQSAKGGDEIGTVNAIFNYGGIYVFRGCAHLKLHAHNRVAFGLKRGLLLAESK